MGLRVKIISGGQSGADQTGLKVARETGHETGGTAPKGYRTEYGPAPWLADYGLVEDESVEYHGRTDKNVRNADGTVIFGSLNEPGSRRTLYTCIRYGKPHIENPTVQDLIDFIVQHKINMLNVAGNRESKHPEVIERVRSVLKPVLEALRDDRTVSRT